MSFKKKIIFVFCILCISIVSNSQVINHYLKNTFTVDSFDGLKFVAATNSRFIFLINENVLEIKLTDTIPIEMFNNFVKNNLYPKFQQRKFPYLLRKNEKQSIDSIRVTDVGLINKRHNKLCAPIVVPILKKELPNNNIEFILYTDSNEGVNIEIYLYDNSMGRVVSYIPLFSGEKVNKDTCELMGLNLVATYQTENVENGIITQIVNDGFNDLWRRKIILNEDMYYEIIWDDNPLSSER